MSIAGSDIQAQPEHLYLHTEHEDRMTVRKLLAALKYDLERCKYRLKKPGTAIVWFFPGFQALAFYRVRRWLNTRSKARNPLWWPIIIMEAVAARCIEIITGIYIDPDATIGPGLYIPHFGGIVIGERVVIGRNCDIHQGVTIGVGGRAPRGYPVVGDRAYIGAGAKVIGPIEIGDDVAIGANAVVTKSIPDRAVAVGIPARIISYEGSFEYIYYPGEGQDIDRIQSLSLRDVLAGDTGQDVATLSTSQDDDQIL
jgi:serine O-acetyltransferase